MFDEAFLMEAARTRRPWTVPVSFGMQLAVVGCFVVAPLVFTEQIARMRLMPNPITAPMRLGSPRPAEGTKVRLVTVPSELRPHGLVLPRRIPTQVAMLVDEPPIDFVYAGQACAGVCGPTGDLNGVPWSVPAVAERPATPPPPPVVRTPEPVRAATPRIKVGGKVQEAMLISRVTPVYPRLAVIAHVSGAVRLAAVISTEGRINELRVVSGHPLLIGAAVDAVRQWIYRPTRLNGDPVEVATEIIVDFNLTRN